MSMSSNFHAGKSSAGRNFVTRPMLVEIDDNSDEDQENNPDSPRYVQMLADLKGVAQLITKLEMKILKIQQLSISFEL